MSQALTTIEKNKQALMAEAKKMEQRLRNVLPDHVPAERQLSFLMLAVNSNPDLLKCSPTSVLDALMNISKLGLTIGGPRPEAYLVPFKSHCTPVIDYRGLLKLIRQSGLVTYVDAKPVFKRELETFEISYGLEPKLVHKPCVEGEPGEFVGAYFLAKMKDTPEPVMTYMTKEQLDVYRQRSMAKNSGPWKTDPVAMYLKTAIRRGANLMPFSAEDKAVQAMELEAANDRGQKVVDIDKHMPKVELDESASKTEKVKATLLAANEARVAAEEEMSESEKSIDAQYQRELDAMEGEQ